MWRGFARTPSPEALPEPKVVVDDITPEEHRYNAHLLSKQINEGLDEFRREHASGTVDNLAAPLLVTNLNAPNGIYPSFHLGYIPLTEAARFRVYQKSMSLPVVVPPYRLTSGNVDTEFSKPTLRMGIPNTEAWSNEGFDIGEEDVIRSLHDQLIGPDPETRRRRVAKMITSMHIMRMEAEHEGFVIL